MEKLKQHIVALLLVAFFFIYFGLELSFNLLLIDIYALPLDKLFGENEMYAARLELFGRILSGFGLSLAIIALLPPHKLFFWKKEQASQLSNSESLIIKSIAFIVLWIVLVPSLRLFVDGAAHATANETKLSAVRAIAYREAYLNELVEIYKFDAFNEIASDPSRRDLVIALLPSLAFSSTGFNAVIERNVEAMANTFLSNRQKQQFADNGLPRLREFDALYQKELKLYLTYQEQYRHAQAALNSVDKIEAETQQVINALNNHLQTSWKHYVQRMDSAYKDMEPYSKNESIQDAHRQFKKQYRKQCKSTACKEDVEKRHAAWLNDTGIADIYVKPDNINFTLFGTEDRVHFILIDGRKNALRAIYHVDEEIEEYDLWLRSPGASVYGQLFLKSKGVELFDGWQLHNTNAIYNAITEKYQQELNTVWPEYFRASAFDIQSKTLGQYDFSLLPIVDEQARRVLGRFYLSNLRPGESESSYLARWLESQNNISFIRMLSSTAAGAAFSQGGALYDVGVDAVKLSIIPQMSILLSFIAVFALAAKFSVQLYKRFPKFYSFLIVGVTSIVLLVPTVKSITSNNSYTAMMSGFSRDFHKNDAVSRIKMDVFGVVLDLENGLFTTYRNSGIKRAVAEPLFTFKHDANGNLKEVGVVKGLRSYDDLFNSVFAFLPSKVFGFSERSEFNANVTLVKPDNSIAAYMGIEVDGQNIESVAIPNFLSNTDFGFLAEQAYLLNHDPIALTVDFISNYDSPDYWVEVANGHAFRTSLIEKLENRLPALIQDNTSLRELLAEQVEKGEANILLLQASAGQQYQCFVMPKLASKELAKALISNQVSYKRIEDCWVKI